MTQPARGASRRGSRRARPDEPLAEGGGVEPQVAPSQPVAVPGLALPGPGLPGPGLAGPALGGSELGGSELAGPMLRRALAEPDEVHAGLVSALRQQSRSCGHAKPGAERSDELTIRRSQDQAIRRAPVPGAVLGEFVDVDAPGFVFLATARPNEYLIKGSDITVTWDAKSGHWLNDEGLVTQFGSPGPTAGPTPQLDLSAGLPLPGVSTLPPLTRPGKPGKLGKPSADVPNPDWTHYPLTMQDFKRLGVYDQMLQLAELASRFPITPYELTLRDNNPSERPTKFYRYHKFPIGFDDPQYVLGGGLNKVEITDEWQSRALKKLIADRQKFLNSLMVSPAKTVKAMEQFQANAMTTPFIATTSDRDYAESLYEQYPPADGQRAVLLVIEGPKANSFDFEEIYQSIKGAGGGKAEWNWRTSADRAKDAGQAEFGLPDLFIPLRGVSPLGFRVIEVVELSMPPSNALSRMTADQRMNVVRARSLPKTPRADDGEAQEL